VKRALVVSFETCDFTDINDNCDVVISQTLALMSRESPDTHLVARCNDGEVVGAILGIPAYRTDGQQETSIGWFFVHPSLGPRIKLKVFDALVELCFDLVREMGFSAIVTEMGSRAGQAALRRRHGFRHVPLPDHENRWIKQL